MRKKPELNIDDQAVFQEAMRDVKPLIQTKIIPPVISTLTLARFPRPSSPANNYAILFPFSDYEVLESVNSDSTLEFFRPGVQRKILRKIRLGQYNIEATLDLHGMVVEEARTALSDFLFHCLDQGIRHILIIHGKGRNLDKPILKNKLNHWLRQTDDILAFCSATAKRGSSGALYVLLRRSHR
jgi:DNA-nicking Smr family endonuclease